MGKADLLPPVDQTALQLYLLILQLPEYHWISIKPVLEDTMSGSLETICRKKSVVLEQLIEVQLLTVTVLSLT